MIYNRLIFPHPFFYKAQAKQNHTEAIDSVVQSEMMHTSMRIPACPFATGRAFLPAQQGEDWPFHVCLLLRSREICLTHRAGWWRMVHIPTGKRGWYCGISTSEQQAGSEGMCTSFLFCVTLLKYSKSIQSHLVSLCLCKGLFCPENRTTPPFPHS